MTLQVIDWKEALQQCGEDEDFLKELMLDLKSESGKQIAAMEEIIRNPTDNPFDRIARSAHVLKGAASNLCCPELLQTSMDLESAAQTAAADAKNQAHVQQVRVRFESLKRAVQNYLVYVQTAGL